MAFTAYRTTMKMLIITEKKHRNI